MPDSGGKKGRRGSPLYMRRLAGGGVLGRGGEGERGGGGEEGRGGDFVFSPSFPPLACFVRPIPPAAAPHDAATINTCMVYVLILTELE